MSRMGDVLIEYGPSGFDCNENDESLPSWVPQPDTSQDPYEDARGAS